jgi:molecular chaperone DnaJ
MAKSYFAILEVASSASPAEVRSAYRRLAKEYHPDYHGGDSKPFQQIQEAYAVLGDPDKRKAYENNLSSIRIQRTARQSPYPEPEPLVPRKGPAGLGEISPIRSFESFSPSFDEIFDWLWHNFSNASRNKSGRVQNLTMEVPLTLEQALRGGNATIMVPAQSVCPACRGFGSVGYYQCQRCAGKGAFSGEVPVSISFPPGITRNHSVLIPLDRFGIRNLYLTVLFRPGNIG